MVACEKLSCIHRPSAIADDVTPLTSSPGTGTVNDIRKPTRISRTRHGFSPS